MINIVCVKWGDKYSTRYVNNLYEGVKNNLKLPHQFHCFTDNSSGFAPGIKVHPLPAGIPYWWNKLYLFSKEMPIKGRIFYLDLDTVIVGDLSQIVQCDKPFVMLQDVYHKLGRGSGLMSWNNEKADYSYLWENFYPNAEKIHKSYWPHGDQVWIQQKLHVLPHTWQELYKGEILSLKVDCVKFMGKPSKAKIIFYHGKPSVEESLNIPNFYWIRKYWK